MEAKPIPKPRTSITMHPTPAPRTQIPSPSIPHSVSPSSSSISSTSDEKNVSTERSRFKSFGTSSRQFKDELSEKMTLKGKAVISGTKNASIRLEKSVKNLLTRRLTTVNPELNSNDIETAEKNSTMDRCTSMPACDDIFSSISFYSPLRSNLKSMKNKEDLTDVRYSPPPSIYPLPPPPPPDESIYDELQSVTSFGSSRHGTLSSEVSDRYFDYSEDFQQNNLSENQKSDSDQSLHIANDPQGIQGQRKRLSRSDSWIYYDSKQESLQEQNSIIENFEGISTNKEVENIFSDLELRQKPARKFLPKNDDENLSKYSEVHTSSHESVTNSLYENWNPQEKRISESVLVEFDPFAKVDENTYGNYQSNDLMLLEELLALNESPSSESSSVEDLHEDLEIKTFSSNPPPPPPKRFDSLVKNEYDDVELVETPDKVGKNPAIMPKLVNLGKKNPAVPPRKFSNLKNISEDNVMAEDVEENCGALPKSPDSPKTSVMQKLKKLGDTRVYVKPNVINFMKNAKLLKHDNTKKQANNKLKLVRPTDSAQIVPLCHRGIVYRSGVGMERAKELVQRAAVLHDQRIFFYADKSMTNAKETLKLNTIQSIHLLQDVKTVDGETAHCIAVSCEGRPNIHVFYVKGLTQRRIWAQTIFEALTGAFPVKYTSEFIRAGWAYLKEGVTGVWFSAWILLYQRTLIYTRSLNPPELEKLDLRKARCILLREQSGPIPSSKNIPVVVLDAGGCGALHLAASGVREGPIWQHALYQAAVNCGPSLNEQQLTQDNVPVILDKCINFIYAHGIMSEGIYRKGGSSSAITRLLEDFRKNAWEAQITRNLYSEHDVATALRRFLRDLPESLLPPSIHDPLCRAIDISEDDERVEAYRTILFPVLNRVSAITLRRILAHLHCLSQQSSRNLMTVENISSVWGPTLMHAGNKNAEQWSRSETKVVGDLIKLYPKLYQLTAADLAKEARILEVLEKHHVSKNSLRGAPSGDLKIWIYLFEKNGECINVTIGPHKTASDVCQELSNEAKIPAQELCLEEYTLNGALERPLHHAEKVLESVARWGYWDSEDRKDNILILKKDRLYKDIHPRIKPPMTMSGELKFADTKAKHFKTYLFEFSQAKLCFYKDKACAVKVHEWRIEDIIWYLGHEPKRNPQMGWSITFILKNKKPTRCKETPFFGNTIAGTSVSDQYKWLSAMLFGEHQLNLLPQPLNLMDP